MVAQIYLAPYCTSSLNITQSSSLLANTLTLFVGLMLIIDYNLEAEAKRAGDTFDITGRSVISVIIVLVNLIVLAIPFFVFATESSIIEKWCSGRKANTLEIDDSESNDTPPVDTLTSTENSPDALRSQPPLTFNEFHDPPSSSLVYPQGTSNSTYPSLPQVTFRSSWA
jgi:hypothetical protein